MPHQGHYLWKSKCPGENRVMRPFQRKNLTSVFFNHEKNMLGNLVNKKKSIVYSYIAYFTLSMNIERVK